MQIKAKGGLTPPQEALQRAQLETHTSSHFRGQHLGFTSPLYAPVLPASKGEVEEPKQGPRPSSASAPQEASNPGQEAPPHPPSSIPRAAARKVPLRVPPTPVVHIPEELQVGLVHHVGDLLPVALHQLSIVHQLLLGRRWEEGRGPVQSSRWESPPGPPWPRPAPLG